MIFGSAKIELNDLTPEQIQSLKILSEMSRDLYNLCIKKISLHYEFTEKIYTYSELKEQVKDSSEWICFNGMYYQTLLTAIADFKKYISTDNYVLSKLDRTLKTKNLEHFLPPKPKMGYRMIEMKGVHIWGGYIMLPRTSATLPVSLPIPECYQKVNLYRISVRPLHHASHWELILEYRLKEEQHPNLDPHRALGIDLGMTNYATCVDSKTGECFIVDGKRLKSILQGYCKYMAAFGSGSGDKAAYKRRCRLRKKTYHRVNDYVAKTAAYIARFCIDHNIGKIVLGWTEAFQGANLGMNSQLFSLIPYAKLRKALEFQAKKHGIIFMITDESYTSQASALDNDYIPERMTIEKQFFSGKRIHRGEYMSGDGIRLNADQNGAMNILRKSNVELPFLKEVGSRGIASPYRIYPTAVK